MTPTDATGTLTTRWALTQRRLVLSPPADHPLWRSHAQAVTVLPVSPDAWMGYFAGRSADNRSRVWAAELDAHTLGVRRLLAERPVLDLGPEGAFDCRGVGAGAVVDVGDRIRLYYMAMGPSDAAPYLPQIGLAESTDGGRSFRRLVDGPVLGAGPLNPFGAAAPTVLRRGDRWDMLYSSFRSWRLVDGKPEPIYDIRRATSRDGVVWQPEEEPLLGLSSPEEGALIRPQVWEADGGLMMTAAVRGWRDFRSDGSQQYRLCLARSADGRTWERCDDLLLYDPPLSPSDWDGTMQCYPWLVRTPSRDVLFYNGNDFGRGGFGCAVLETRPAAGAGAA